MSQETKKRVHLIYGIVLSIVTVFAGICFIAACLNIYYSGIANDVAQIYTRQIVAENFGKIAIPVYSCLTLVIGGMVLDLALPIEKPKRKPQKNLPLILQRLHAKTDLASCDESLRKAVEKHIHLRKICTLVCTAALGIGFVVFLVYACNANRWGTNSTPSMISAVYVMLPCLGIPFASTVIATYRNRKSMEKEIELMRQAAAQTPKKLEKTAIQPRSNKPVNIARIAIFAIGVTLVVLGACNEGTKDILTKAVNICTECVGLG